MIYKKKFDILTKFFPQIEKLLDVNKIRSGKNSLLKILFL